MASLGDNRYFQNLQQFGRLDIVKIFASRISEDSFSEEGFFWDLLVMPTVLAKMRLSAMRAKWSPRPELILTSVLYQEFQEVRNRPYDLNTDLINNSLFWL